MFAISYKIWNNLLLLLFFSFQQQSESMEEDDTETLERKLREKALQSMQRHKSPEAPPEQDDD